MYEKTLQDFNHQQYHIKYSANPEFICRLCSAMIHPMISHFWTFISWMPSDHLWKFRLEEFTPPNPCLHSYSHRTKWPLWFLFCGLHWLTSIDILLMEEMLHQFTLVVYPNRLSLYLRRVYGITTSFQRWRPDSEVANVNNAHLLGPGPRTHQSSAWENSLCILYVKLDDWSFMWI